MSAQDSAKTVEILEKLKSAILNIDWEISDDNITLLNQELAGLRATWEGQKVHQIYLQILGALSQYIATNKENANPGAFPMLRNVFSSLEDMVMNPGDDEQQNKTVMAHVEAYNELKNAVATGEPPAPAEPEPATPEPEPVPEPEPEPEIAVQEEAPEEEEEPSTINRLLNDDEDHTTDSIFDSMLDEMVQTEPPDDTGETEAEPEAEPEAAPEPPPAPPAPPKAPPPVQAAYNKDDGTEIEADRNIADEFAEADELLDDFFVDDVAAPNGVAAGIKGDEFDLSDLDEGEGGVLDLEEAPATTSEPAEEKELDLSFEEDTDAGGPEADVEEGELEFVEDSGLDIFKVDESEEANVAPDVAEGDQEFPEMESALDDFFEGETDTAAPSMATPEPAVETAPSESIEEVDAALDDFFEDDEQKAPEVAQQEPEVEVPVSPPPAAEGTVEGLKALLISVDWEVDDKLLERADAEISVLREKLADNHTALIHLNFLNTVIHHIGEKEHSQVISESMACLKMITESLEKLVSGGGSENSQFAAQAVSSFIDWHELVVAEFEKRLAELKKQGGDLAESIETLELEAGEGETTETQKLKKEILSEVREILSKEMNAIRQELSAKS